VERLIERGVVLTALLPAPAEEEGEPEPQPALTA
jgi:hypothetical protein